MSIDFNEPMSNAALARMREMFPGGFIAADEKTALIEPAELTSEQMKELANLAGQPATLNLHGQGEIKTMADGTQYKVTPKGWVKMQPVEQTA